VYEHGIVVLSTLCTLTTAFGGSCIGTGVVDCVTAHAICDGTCKCHTDFTVNAAGDDVTENQVSVSTLYLFV